METPVEIRYAGVVVGSATEILRAAGNESGMFLVVSEPLPVGSVVTLGPSDLGRVEKVVESTDPRSAGMYVRLLSEEDAARPWVPQLPDTIPLPPPRRVPTPPSVPLVSPRVAEARPTLSENGERRPTILGPVPPPAAPDRSGTIVAPLVLPARTAEHDDRRNTLVWAPPPPAEEAPPPAARGTRASGEFHARIPTPVPAGGGETAGQISPPATIVVAPEAPAPADRDGTVEAAMDDPPSEPITTDNPGSLEDLPPARPLPAPDARRRATRPRRNNRGPDPPPAARATPTGW